MILLLSDTGFVPVDHGEIVAKCAGLRTLSSEPLGDSRIEILGDISHYILKNPALRVLPQYVALSYWLRKAAIRRLVSKWQRIITYPDTIAVARGLALHLPPTNVDTIFVYSWALSLLAGNSNIVRLPSNPDTSVRVLGQIIAGVLKQHGEDDRHLFVSFDHEGTVLEVLSSLSDVRMIWGGNAKVDAVSRLPVRPDGISIGFPDRRSFSIISTIAYASASDEKRNSLSASFYNDLFWFDQMACGSPRQVIWVGGNTTDAAILTKDFAARIYAHAVKQDYRNETATVIAKMVAGYGFLADAAATRYDRYGNILDMVSVQSAQDSLDIRQGGGFLISAHVENLDAIPHLADPALQTITHYGFDRDELTRCARSLSSKGGYRIVPIGEALQFDEIWDGVPLFSHLTRNIVIRTGM